MNDLWPKIVVHADMDAFYASVEQLDDPALRGKPVLVGPNSGRGVVLAASYEARPFGVGSAMPVAEAKRRCPSAIMVPPRFERYQDISAQVMDVFADFSPTVEPLSLDEAFLDMSGASHLFGSPHAMGNRLKQAVFERTGLHISVGISGTKYVAKVASAHDKPQGLTIVPPDTAQAWLAPLPVSRLWGVGKKTAPRLQARGLSTIGDVANADLHWLRKLFGRAGDHYFQLANGRDPRKVTRGRGAKSIGSDRTLSKDLSHRDDIRIHLQRSADRIARRLRTKGYRAGGVRVRLKTTQFEMLTRQVHIQPTDTAQVLFATGSRLLEAFDHPGPFRLVGMAVFDLQWENEDRQLDFFATTEQRRLEQTMDQLVSRFGQGAVFRARDISRPGTVLENGVNLDFLDYRDGERVSRPI